MSARDPNDRLMKAAEVRAFLGGAGKSSLLRWEKTLGFPAPIYIGEHRAWWRSEVENWIASQAARAPKSRRGNVNANGSQP